MTRDMRPYQAGHDVALPDAAAQHLLDIGAAKVSEKEAASGLKPDPKPAPGPLSLLPRNRYVTRKG